MTKNSFQMTQNYQKEFTNWNSVVPVHDFHWIQRNVWILVFVFVDQPTAHPYTNEPIGTNQV